MAKLLRTIGSKLAYLAEPGVHVVICGSMKHKDAMIEMAHRLVELGHVPVLPIMGVNGDGEWLNRLHWEKLQRGDVALIVNPDGYVGPSTFSEITVARFLNKPVFITNPISDGSVGVSELRTWELDMWVEAPTPKVK